jgi:enterochelin esterase family protein
MGGVQTLNLSLWHPENFAFIFPISTGYFPDSVKQIEEKYSAAMQHVASHPFTLFVIGRGKDDNLTMNDCQATLKLLESYGIEFQYKELDGAHSFVFSRRFLTSFYH